MLFDRIDCLLVETKSQMIKPLFSPALYARYTKKNSSVKFLELHTELLKNSIKFIGLFFPM